MNDQKYELNECDAYFFNGDHWDGCVQPVGELAGQFADLQFAKHCDNPDDEHNFGQRGVLVSFEMIIKI